ncbi:MAG: multidrug ABC transporter ATP-binding protein [Acidobacteria bacterium RIFCSPLOWO2_12_FULL_54_10]|nr:MAG: multidrug ABC transporter ATP-binding protein [Acidobacteria bacterium RIFCSPLOWO2_12_FULL_54_10]
MSLTSDNPSSVIRTEGLRKSFGKIQAIKNLSLNVERGEMFGLVGPDGAGKTTVMRLLSAVLDPDAGDAWVLGRHTVKESEAVKDQIAYMSQRFGLYPDLTVIENLLFYTDIYDVPRGEREKRIRRLLSFSNLGPFQKRQARDLSGGMKQKLGLACALVHTPKVLLLDEPTNGVDPLSRREFWKILNGLLREQVTIFISTSYLDEAERCHRVALLNEGELLACGTPDEVKQMMRGTILEVRTSNPRSALEVLRKHFPAQAARLFGDRIHLVADSAAKAQEQAEKAFAEEGIKLLSVREIEPGLEDVFLSVLASNH